MNAPVLQHAPDDDFDSEFPGCVLTHNFYVTTGDHLDIALETLTAVRHIGARVDGMTLSRTSGAIHHKLRVTGIKPKDARLLARQFASVPGVTCATVEHAICSQPS